MRIKFKKLVGRYHSPLVPIDVKNAKDGLMYIIRDIFQSVNAETYLSLDPVNVLEEIDAFLKDAIPRVMNSQMLPPSCEKKKKVEMVLFGEAGGAWLKVILERTKANEVYMIICMNNMNDPCPLIIKDGFKKTTPESVAKYMPASILLSSNATYGLPKSEDKTSSGISEKCLRNEVHVSIDGASTPADAMEILRKNGINIKDEAFYDVLVKAWNAAMSTGARTTMHALVRYTSPLGEGVVHDTIRVVINRDVQRFSMHLNVCGAIRFGEAPGCRSAYAYRPDESENTCDEVEPDMSVE